MKSFFLKSNLMTLMLVALTSLTFISCDKEDAQPPLKETLVGTWDITSYRLDGDEWIGFIVDEAHLRFDAYTGEEGTFLESVTFPEEEPVTQEGAYSTDDDADQVAMEYDGQIIVAEIRFDGPDRLEWNGEESNYPLVIKAVRRQ